jgi:hypothetical protein
MRRRDLRQWQLPPDRMGVFASRGASRLKAHQSLKAAQAEVSRETGES